MLILPSLTPDPDPFSVDELPEPKDSPVRPLPRQKSQTTLPSTADSRYDACIMASETLPPSFTHAPAAKPASHFASAQRILQDAIANRAFPGCAYGVFANGRVVLEEALGTFTYDEPSLPVTSHTLYDVASLTKVAATTAAAMLLHQEGRLDLDTPVGDLLPGFVIGRPAGTQARHVKVRHLLAHNSGLPGYVEFFKTHSNATGVLRACLELSLEAAPAERAEYSDPGFILLGKALEVIMREPLCNYLHRELYHPLGMHHTRFNPGMAQRLAIPPTEHDTTFRHRIVQGEVQDENAWLLGGAAGHAGLFSNVHDLLRLSETILASAGHSTASGHRRIFEPAIVELFATRQEPTGSTRALGWDTPSTTGSASGSHFSPHSIGHLGFSGCSLWIDLDEGVAIVLLTNRTWPDRQTQQIKEVRPAFHDAIRDAL
jgi:CubicO group peptidase (beta-lactamase class C family)